MNVDMRRTLLWSTFFVLCAYMISGCAAGTECKTQLDALRNELSMKDRLLSQKEEAISDKAQEIDRLNREYQNKVGQIEDLKRQVTQLEGDVRQKKKEFEACREELKSLTKSKSPEIYVTKKGDWLSKIALYEYGDLRLWPLIWDRNKFVIMADTGKDDSNLIWVHQRLKIFRDFTPKQKQEAINRHDQMFGNP